MAQTKLDLSDGKFEQCTSEVLHLSGCTRVFGQFQLESGSTLSILSNHGAGKVLTSDAGGNGTWQVISGNSGIINASNGLTRIGTTDVVLGGVLTGNTCISTNLGNLTITGNTNAFGIYSDSNAPIIGIGDYLSPLGGLHYIYLDSVTTLLHNSDGSDYYIDLYQIPTSLYICAQNIMNLDYSCIYFDSTYANFAACCSSSGYSNQIYLQPTNVCIGSTHSYIDIDTLNKFTYITQENGSASSFICIGSASTWHYSTNGVDSVSQICHCGGSICLNTCDYIVGKYTQLNINTDIISIEGYTPTGFTGVQYASDYSANYTNRSLVDKEYVDTHSSSGTSNSGQNITKFICQPSHGFIVGDVIGWSGGTYNKAIADGLYNGEVLGLVSKCYNANCFNLVQTGYVTGLTSLSANTTYFLSTTTPGLLSTINPTGNTLISKAVLVATSSDTAWVLSYPGYIVTTGSSGGGISVACNGLTTDGTTVCLGGTLTGTTTIIDSRGTPTGIEYGGDYSNTYTNRSLVDKGYVDTRTSGTTLHAYTITGDSVTTGFTVTHNLNETFVGIEIVKNTNPYPTVYTNTSRPTANSVCITFDIAPDTGQEYKILIFSSGNTGNGSSYLPLIAQIHQVTGTTYTIDAGDLGKNIEFTNAGAVTITLPTGLTVGFQAVLVNVGGSDKCMTAGTGATLYTLGSKIKISGAYNAATVYYREANKWVGFGNLS